MTKTDLAKDIAALAVVGVAYASFPSAITALGAAPSLIGLGGRIMSFLSPDLHHITAHAVDTILADMRHSSEIDQNLLADAGAVLHNMPDATQLTQAQLVTVTKNGTVLVDDLVALLMTQIPQGTNIHARGLIETALSAGVRACTTTDVFRTTLSFSLLQDLSRDVAQVRNDAADIRETLEQLLSGTEGVQRPELNTLAHRFGHPKPDAAGLTELKSFLQQKAEDLRRYQAQIDAIDDRVAGLGSLKVAAKNAAERLDLSEVEILLAGVDQVETEIAAQTKELRADNALLQGKVEAAYSHLSGAADSFQGLDPVETIRRKVEYAGRLYNHGLHYSGEGLSYAIRMFKDTEERLQPNIEPFTLALLEKNLGLALSELGSRHSGDDATQLLKEANRYLKSSIAYYKEHNIFDGLVMALLNHALNFKTLGTKSSQDDARKYFVKARLQLREALKIINKFDIFPMYTPQEFAELTSRLYNAKAVTLLEQSRLPYRGNTEMLLKFSLNLLRLSQSTISKTAGNEQWALIEMNIGIILDRLAILEYSKDKVSLIQEAVSAFDSASDFFHKEKRPIQWAAAIVNRANSYKHLGLLSSKEDCYIHFHRSIEDYLQAFTIYSKLLHPQQWADVHENIALLHYSRVIRAASCNSQMALHLAIAHIDQALGVYQEVQSTFKKEKALWLRDDLRAALSGIAEK